MSELHGGDIYNKNIRLDFSVNVNPYGMPEAVREALRDAVSKAENYPEYSYLSLRHVICHYEQAVCSADGTGNQDGKPSNAKHMGLRETQIVVGNGASELIMALAHALTGEKVLLQQPNFSGYERAFSTCGCQIEVAGSQEDFSLSDSICRQIADIKPRAVALCSPGNPTGAVIGYALLKEIADACRDAGALLLIDECFLGFAAEADKRSAATLFGSGADIAVLRAFTKLYAMPGVRLGYLVCSKEETAEQIASHLPEWNISAAAEAAGRAALLQKDYARETTKKIRRDRAVTADGLQKLGMRVINGEANFILFHSERELYAPLLEKGILIRDCSNFAEMEDGGWYRIAVRKPEENAELLDAIREIAGGT